MSGCQQFFTKKSFFCNFFKKQKHDRIEIGHLGWEAGKMSFDELIEFLLTPAAQIGIVIGLTEVFKSLGISKKIFPLVALVIGIVCGSFIYGYVLQYGLSKGVVIGTALGLASSGLFSHTKIFKAPTPKNENSKSKK